MTFFNRDRLPVMLGAAAAAAITAGALIVSTANAAPPGDAAPAFKEANTAGKEISLADFKGKTVILEWTNDGCPFVQKHYNSQNMQKTQAAAAKDAVRQNLAIPLSVAGYGDVTVSVRFDGEKEAP